MYLVYVENEVNMFGWILRLRSYRKDALFYILNYTDC